MADLLLDGTNDLDTTGGVLSITPTLADTLKQRLNIKFKLFKGEYVYDINAGVDYYGQVLRKGVTKEFLDNFFIDQILATEGVERMQSFSSVFNTGIRSYSVDFTVIAIDGSTVISTL